MKLPSLSLSGDHFLLTWVDTPTTWCPVAGAVCLRHTQLNCVHTRRAVHAQARTVIQQTPRNSHNATAMGSTIKSFEPCEGTSTGTNKP